MIIPGLINTTWAIWVHQWDLPVFPFHLKLCLLTSPSPGEDWGLKFLVTRRAHRTSTCSHLVYLHTCKDCYTNQHGLLWARVSSPRIGIRCGLPRIPRVRCLYSWPISPPVFCTLLCWLLFVVWIPLPWDNLEQWDRITQIFKDI